ncbi:nucleoside-diphosphate-sugar epimerase [Neofusicoccum parvum]|uniref:Nucleoside-diphosphate-sugar epimerase n=1 Tax=Neofusicoccum parvum TaxID=310453 RepID=A0ACB5SGV3_9PEZI|nr:nucleoside-diphosphate-sugar epimerase [Neofusicoccum parvum]
MSDNALLPSKSPKVALVSGCNGISGHAIVEHLVQQPDSEWSKIVITSRRPPPDSWADPRVEFVAVDFLAPKEKAVEALKPLCGDVTHAYFTSYVHNDDLTKLTETNAPLFRNFMDVVESICPKLDRVCLQTGGKYYGVHLGPTKQPVNEDMPRYDDKGLNFYYPQEDYLCEAQERRNKWSYNIIRPVGIIGFTPRANGMSMALSFAVYLIINAELGVASTPFLGSEFLLDSVDDVSHAPSLADMTVWATTHEHTRNEVFNHASGDLVVWRHFWPQLAEYFGVKIEKPTALNTSVAEWARDKRAVWHRLVQRHGGSPDAFDWCTWAVFDWVNTRDWLIVASIAKARRMGWARFDGAEDMWVRTFASFEDAGVLPRASVVRAAAAAAAGGAGVN